MQRKKLNKFVCAITTISFLMGSNVQALDLQTKVKTTDKRTYNTNPGVQINPGQFSFFGEFNYTNYPLVTRGTYSGNVSPLVDSLMGFDLGMNYGLTSWMQLGVLLPMEMPNGAEKGGTFLTGPLFEAKLKFFENFAIVPFYQMSSSSKIMINNEGVMQEVNLGAPKGTYGLKLVGEMGDIRKSWGLAGQLGYSSSPDNKFANIDQSSRILMGLSGGMAVSEKISAGLELYGEKTTSNFPLEALGFVNYYHENLMFQAGAGSGNLQGSGSNTFKGFVGVVYSFGGEKRGTFMPNGPAKRGDYKYIPRAKDIKNQPEDGDMDEQKGPEVINPSKPEAPVIPDVESSVKKVYSRNIASTIAQNQEIKDPLAELVNPPAPAKKVKKEVKKLPEKLEKSLENKKPEVKKAKVKKEEGRFETLPNGKKVKVFSKQINELPKEVGVEYVTEEGYKEMLAKVKLEMEEAKKKPLVKESQVVSKEEAVKPMEVIAPTPLVLEEKKLETPEVKEITMEPTLKEEKNKEVIPAQLVKEEDPMPMMPETAPLVQEEKVEEVEKTPIVIKEKQEEVVPLSYPSENPVDMAKKEEKPQEQNVSPTPLSIETVKTREELKRMLEEEFNKPAGDRLDELKAKAQEENRIIEEKMQQKIKEEEELSKKLAEEEQKRVYAEKEEIIKKEAPLSEGPADKNPQAPAKDNELKPVRLDNRNRKDKVISLPQAKLNSFLEGKSLEEASPATEENLNLLEDADAVEEASGPSYGFDN